MPFGPASLVVAPADVPPVSLPGPAAIACAKACTPKRKSGINNRLDRGWGRRWIGETDKGRAPVKNCFKKF
jgi:hypothetical protein